MTNETKPSTRRLAGIALILLAIVTLFLIPATRDALATGWNGFIEIVRQTPGQVFAGLENVWDWIF